MYTLSMVLEPHDPSMYALSMVLEPHDPSMYTLSMVNYKTLEVKSTRHL